MQELKQELKDSELQDSMEEFYKQLNDSIEEDRGIKVITYELNEQTEKQIDEIIDAIFKKYNRIDLKAAVYTCIKELVVNASKANFKWLYFKENNYSIKDPEIYMEKSMEFKKFMSKDGLKEMAKLAREKNFDVNILFQYNSMGCRVKIINKTPITPEDDKRIRNRLKVGSQYDDIAMFYMDHADSLEGAGIGIALIQILLRGEKIDHKSFTIWTNDEGITTAKLDFPFVGERFPGTREREKRKGD